MSEAPIQLPTAAPSRVRQRAWCSLGARHRRQLQASGAVLRLPVVPLMPHEREAAERRDLYERGGLHRNATLLFATAVFAALDDDGRERAALMVRALSYGADDAAEAAETYLRDIESACRALARSPATQKEA